MVEFYFKQEEIKVPDNILKSKDLTETYLNAQKIKEIGEVLVYVMSEVRGDAGQARSNGGSVIRIHKRGGVNPRHPVNHRVCHHPGGSWLPTYAAQGLHGQAKLYLIYSGWSFTKYTQIKVQTEDLESPRTRYIILR